MKIKKIISVALSAVMTVSVLSSPIGIITAEDTVTGTGAYNYGEALQKSLFFYEAQQSGPIADWNEVSWRAGGMENDYVPGGWFDAGDHLKFSLTVAYSATMLSWGMLEYGDGVDRAAQTTDYERNLQWGLDYLVGCDLGDKVVYMIGEGSFDHVWWGSAEVYMEKYKLMKSATERPYYTTTNAAITADMAAALASGYLVFKDSDPDKANEYLKHAINCFNIADKDRSVDGQEAQASYYKCSTFYDDLFYAANWLYKATGEKKYLDLCESDYIANLGTENQSTERKYTWGMCWDDVMQGGALLYAMNTGKEEWKTQMQKHLDYWTVGYGGKQVTYTPDGLAWLFNWGALRHATTTAFLAYVASDELFADNATLNKRYTDFADAQMNYCFGDNSNNYSYVIGMGDTYPKAWHHRTSSGVWNDKWSGIGLTTGDDPKQHAHILYGALVGGPNSNGVYTDVVNNYECSEVAIDYNAGYTAALCAMVEKYGGTSDSNFPPESESVPKWDEFYIEACINQASSNYTEVKVQATNHSAWPARVVSDLSYNYYMDFTELFKAGYTANDVNVKIGYDEFQNCTISKPIQYDGNIYYVKISYADGTKIMPTGQSEHQGEIQFRVSVPDATSFWDATNDYSFSGLVQQTVAVTDKITMYDGDKLIWGTEPDGSTPEDETTTPETTVTETTETTTKPVNETTTPSPETTVTATTTSSNSGDNTTTNQEKIMYGDVNSDGRVTVADVILINKYMAGMVTLTDNQLKCGDVTGDGKVNNIDGLKIMKLIGGLISSLN